MTKSEEFFVSIGVITVGLVGIGMFLLAVKGMLHLINGCG